MRRFIPLGLLAAVMSILTLDLSAQAPKSDPKKDAKDSKLETKPDPKDEIKWPKTIQGKSLEAWVKEIRHLSDASARDAALRTVPLFGPAARKAASTNLLYTIQREPDINVRITAIQMAPVIGFDDPDIPRGITALIDIITPANGHANHTRYEATMALASCGPLVAKRAVPTLLTYTLKDGTSWQNRKAAAFALGRLGQEIKKGDGPDVAAVNALADALERDSSHQVKKEIISSLLLLGPPYAEATWKKERAALSAAIRDSDISYSMSARVVFIRTELEFIKPTDPNLVAIVKNLSHSEPAVRAEAIKCLAVLGNEAKSKLDDLIAIATMKGKKEEEIKEDDLALAAAALWAMSTMNDEEVIGKILKVIDPIKRHKNEALKRAAEDAYKTLTQNPKDPLNEPKKDPKKDIVPKKM